jgi:hypothetical protein
MPPATEIHGGQHGDMHIVPGLKVLYCSRTTANLERHGECVLNLPSSDMADAVDRIALTTGQTEIKPYRRQQGYVHVKDKFALGSRPTWSNRRACGSARSSSNAGWSKGGRSTTTRPVSR